MRSIIDVPYLKDGRWKFLLSVARSTAGTWHADEIELIRQLSERIYMGVERSRAEAALRASEDRKAFLLSLSDSLRPLRDPLEVQRVAVAALGLHLKVNRALYFEVQADGDTVRTGPAYLDGVAALPPLQRMSDFGEVTAQYRRNESSVAHDVLADPLLGPAVTDRYAAIDVRAGIGVPLLKEGRVVSVIGVHQAKPRTWTATDVSLIEAVAERTWEAVERARAEAALRESEALMQALIENLPGGAVFVVDQDLRYLIAEGEAITVAGLKSSDFLGKSIREALQEDLVSEYEPFFRKALAGEHFEHEHKSHEHVYLTRGVPLRTAGGEVYAVLAASFDITARKRAEGESREADKRKDEFLAMLAHELRNPLAAIGNATQLMKYLTHDDATVQRPREVIERQLQQLTRLVDDLLDMSRLTWSKINLQQETLSLATMLQRAVEASRPLIDARGHQLTITLPPLSTQVVGDSTRLVQVFGNLLNNAAKYTDTGGHIALHTAVGAEEAIIRVRDNGCGLSASLLPHVFELFTQAGRSLDRSQGGLGVGLALVRSLVKMHGGEVEAHSAGLGQGSEFVVRLPLACSGDALEHTSAKNVTDATTTIAPRLKVLVVEDNADAAEMLVLILRHKGDDVRLARDGPTALEAARDFQPQVVLCDLGLPGLSGFEVAARLREQPECRGTLLVALSGYGRDEDRRQSQSAGFDHHLTKPVDPEVLAALIDQRRLA
ncbi:MAG: response regulator [Ramlibacter sp.]|nr:response regulator [Ramlibacter sp.]